MRTRLVAGNWKMHGSRAENGPRLKAIAQAAPAIAGVECAVCVPFPYLAQAAEALAGSGVALGAQNVSEHEPGAWTGEVCASMLADFGCRYAIVGHSERRQHFGESDRQVAAKFGAALAHGLVPILCVGETLAEREAGRTGEVVGRQLEAVLERAGRQAFAQAVIAYEPVWAIGTGKTATPAMVQEVHALLREQVLPQTRILYGGSVKAANAAALFALPDVDGGLIGGASLVAEEFLAIARAAQRKD
ncbi:MAG: triose-phosphate isomerase [Burkholderiales bacterium]|nr:triose-phosphate isomerase [Burkholderiales bacterium]